VLFLYGVQLVLRSGVLTVPNCCSWCHPLPKR
jgi:hypothetical protein